MNVDDVDKELKMENRSNNAKQANSVCWILFIVFLILKLTGEITWSWWWVTAPLWIPFALAIVVIIVCSIVLGLITAFEKK